MQNSLQLPEAFLNSISEQLKDDSEAFIAALHEIPPISLRINSSKYKNHLAIQDQVAWAQQGYYLNERPVFTLDPHFHAGAYYVQEASSMFLEQLILQNNLNEKPIMVLDLCAAPGGKTTHLLSLLHPDSLVVANEVIISRYEILRENIIKSGFDNCLIFNLSTEQLANRFTGLFDLVLVDAPCSGEGLFRKDPESIAHWTAQSPELCSTRQKTILEHADALLKQRGTLIYCTCTYNTKENDQQIHFLQNELQYSIVPIDVSNFPSITNRNGWYQFYPHKIKGEGFFCCALQKPEDHGYYGKRSKVFKHLSGLKDKAMVYPLLNEPEQFEFDLDTDNMVYALPKRLRDFYNHLQVDIKYSTWLVGQVYPKEFVPSHELLMKQKWMNKSNVNTMEVEKSDALKFLKGETIILTGDKGLCAISFEGQLLGWAKNLGNRINNYYPKHYRIRMSIQ
jgi:16S rRNA C967 or C1407 C5-methylase (RsmB/RsmF family)/NOL1/NOP2/fmu family ribosome biogenesis protein